MAEEKKALSVEKKAMSRIADNERQNWYSIAFIWIGIMISIPTLMVGGILSGSLPFSKIVIASVIGYGIIGVIMSLNGIISSDLGLPSAMTATKGFGDKGSTYITSIISFIGCIGWFGVQTATCAAAFSTLMAYFGIPNFPLWIGSILWGAVMLITSVTGFTFMKWLNYIAVPLLVVMCSYGGIYGVNQIGSAGLLAHLPAVQMSMTEAISICIGSIAVGGVICGDYSRYSKNRTHTVLASFGGVVPSGIFMLVIGSIMAISAGEYDITLVFASMGVPVISMLILILATWTTNTGNAYGAGLAFMKIGNFKDELRPKVTLFVGIFGIILALTGLANALISFISVISAITPSVAGVMIADYWFIGKGKPENWYRVKGFNWIGILSWIIGSVVGLFFSFFSPGLDSIIVAMAAYVVLYAICGKTSMAGQGRMALPGEEDGAKEEVHPSKA